jgi:hypothetical protein
MDHLLAWLRKAGVPCTVNSRPRTFGIEGLVEMEALPLLPEGASVILTASIASRRRPD